MEYFSRSNLTITRHTKGKIPNLPFVAMKNAILGKDYELDLSFVTTERAIELHKTWKKKDTPVDILSFPFDEKEGEMIMSLNQARIRAKEYGRTYLNHLGSLFIHGLFHLKGYDHGSTMETLEREMRQKFKFE